MSVPIVSVVIELASVSRRNGTPSSARLRGKESHFTFDVGFTVHV